MQASGCRYSETVESNRLCTPFPRARGRTQQRKTAKATLVYPCTCVSTWTTVDEVVLTQLNRSRGWRRPRSKRRSRQCTDDMPPLLRRQRSKITKAKLGLCEIAGGLEQGKAKATFCSEQTIVRSDSAFRSPNAQQLCLYRYTAACRQAGHWESSSLSFFFFYWRESSFPVRVCQPHDNILPCARVP